MGALGLNATILAQIFNFIVLLILLRLVAYKPIMGLLEKRKELISSSIAAAEEDKKQAEQLRAALLADLKRSKEEAQAVIQKATKAGEEQALQIIEAAKAEATRIKESALSDIQQERDKAVAELKDQVATLSVLVAGKVINRTMNAEIQQGLVKEFIKEAGDLR